MRIEHVAIWTKDINRLKDFYVSYFQATANEKYTNEARGFSSYFLTFQDGARLEIMSMACIKDHAHAKNQYLGYAHLAFSVGNMFHVMRLTEDLRKNGYLVVSEARTTGDGYFESVVLDPDGNRIEITTT